MQIVYLATALSGIAWFARYYAATFPEGAVNALGSLQRTEALPIENPQIGHPTGQSGTRALIIPRTPFTLLYRVRSDRIEVLRIHDQRSGHGRL